MIISTKYRIRFQNGSSATAILEFDSLLKLKVVLSKISAAPNMSVRVYKVVATLNTTTHVVSFAETELTQF